MKKLIYLLMFVILGLSNLHFIIVQAQDLPTPVIQQDNTNQPDLPIGDAPDQPVATSNTSEADLQQSFIRGGIAGILLGLVLGGILAWLFKDKIIKNNG